mgnify:CR=1 FL=1
MNRPQRIIKPTLKVIENQATNVPKPTGLWDFCLSIPKSNAKINDRTILISIILNSMRR